MEHFILDLLTTPRGRAIVALMLVALGTVFIAIAWPDTLASWRLKRSRAVVDAEVVETRVGTGQHGEAHYELRYRFHAPGYDGWFTREERGTGRTGLWSQLGRPEWERAGYTGRLPVVYVPTDPRINVPVGAESSARSDVLAGLIIGSLCATGGLVWLAVMAARRLVGPAQPEVRLHPGVATTPRQPRR